MRKSIAGTLQFSIGILLGLLTIQTSFAQTQITGTVTDGESGEALIGASILVKGTTTGTITDIDGSYSISATATDILIFSFVGYNETEEVVGNRSVVDVSMSVGQFLDEVVVTGYGTQSRRNITGAVTSVKADEISKLPFTSVEQALQGRAAGVSVTSSGAPGSGTSIRIRGYGTIGNNDPLYIIDGTPTIGGIREINPNDIESIQILKDASAASIYGARAGNGVIIITTKNGSVSGKSSLKFDAYYGTQSVSGLPELMNPQQLADYIWELQLNAGQTPSHGQYGSGSTPVLPDFINGDPSQPYDRVTNAITRANKAGTDWLNEIFESAPIYSVNLSASGGNENGQFALSGSITDQQGVVIHTKYRKYTARANTLFRVNDWLRVGENFTTSFGDNVTIPGGIRATGNAISMAFRSPQIIPVFDEEGNFAGSKGGNLTNAANPVSELFRNKDNNSTNLRTFGNAFIEIDFIEGLTGKSSINIDYNTNEFKGFTFPNPEDIEGSATANRLDQSTSRFISWTWYNTLNYNRTFADDHNVGVLVGTEAIENSFEAFSASRSGFASFDPSYWYLSVGEGGIQNASSGVQSSLFSIFGKVNYNFQEKYLISATVRRDGSSRFGPSNRYGVFPAFNAGWRISDEDFLAENAAITDLKLRVGWGKTGNQEIGNYRFLPAFGFSLARSAYDIGGTNSSVVPGFDQTVNANPDIKWEETQTLNIGFDLTLKNNFSLVFDWYKRETSDMLIQVPSPSTAAIAADPFRNVGDVENIGVDIALNYNKSVNQDFNYSVGVNFGAYSNEVTNLGGENVNFNAGNVRGLSASRIQEGMPIAFFYGLEIEGIFQTQAEVDAHAEQAGAGVGRFKFRDVNGDGVINLGGDETFIGSPHPDFSYGINLNFSYKGFDLSLFGQGVQGNDLFNANKYFTHFNTFQGNRSIDVLQSFGFPGATVPSAEATLPLVASGSSPLETNSTSFFIENGSYFKLKNMQIGYNFEDLDINQVGLSSLRVYLQGTNLFTITNYTGLDPEVGNANFYGSFSRNDWGIGIDSGFYPVTRTITFGISAEF